jgi:predicted phosphohydrolase
MKVFALSDPHLSFGTPNKEMDRFGAQWVGHARKIEARWRERVGERDLVLVPGDVSWAMTLEQARPDLEFLGALPGVKVLVKGNHDYWWATISKVRRALPQGMHALQGDAVRVGDVAIGGTRLWDAPDVSFHDWIDWQPSATGAAISAERTLGDQEESRRIWERELGRLDRALAAMEQAAAGGALRIAATHYPPCGPDLAPTPASERIVRSGARHAIFGHLHSMKREPARVPFGERDGVKFTLAACDWIDFAPIEVAST